MLYWFLKILTAPLMYIYFKPKIKNRKNLKVKGKAVFISNHIHAIDPIFISFMMGRAVCWMAKIELFKNKAFGSFLKGINVFPVNRGSGDLGSIRFAIRLLNEGKILGMFPEGKRIKTGEIGAFEPGAAMLAIKTDSPVIPVYAQYDYGLFRRVKVIVGEQIDLNEYTGKKHNVAAVQQATEYLRNRIVSLKKEFEEGKKN